MAGDALRERAVNLPSLYPDVEALPGVVPWVLEIAAFVSGDVHEGFSRVVGTEDVGVDVGAVMGVTDNVFLGEMFVREQHGLVVFQTPAVEVVFGKGFGGVFRGRAAGGVPFPNGAFAEEVLSAFLDAGDLP